MKRISIIPTANGEYQIEAPDFGNILRRSHEISDWGKAAEMRFGAVQQLLEHLADDEDIQLDWNHVPTRQAMELIYASATDYISINEVEMAVALWETLAAVDQEDHMSVSIPLAFCYVVLEDFDCLESVKFDISPKMAEYHLLALWEEYFRTQGIALDSLRMLRTRHKEWFGEILATEHPINEEYLADSRKDKPSPTTEARELWFVLEPLMESHPEFLEMLRRA